MLLILSKNDFNLHLYYNIQKMFVPLQQRSAVYFGSRAGLDASQTLSGHKI